MEITAGTIYLISLATNIKLFLLVVVFGIVIASPFIVNYLHFEYGMVTEKAVCILTAIAVTLLFFGFVIPGSKTLIAMYVIPELLSVQGIEDLPANAVGFLNDYLNPTSK